MIVLCIAMEKIDDIFRIKRLTKKSFHISQPFENQRVKNLAIDHFHDIHRQVCRAIYTSIRIVHSHIRLC